MLRMAREMELSGLECFLYGNSGSEEITRRFPNFKPLIPRPLKFFVYHAFAWNTICRSTSLLFARHVRGGDVAYLWPGATPELYKILRRKGVTTITEMINTCQSHAREVLLKEFQNIGLPYRALITQKSIEQENQILSLSDYFFSPSPEVSSSLVKAGVNPKKILKSTYGINAQDRVSPKDAIYESGKLNFLHVGTIGVRKGVHRLIEAWVNSSIEGTLTLAGNIDPEFKPILDNYLVKYGSRINVLPYTENISEVFQSANIFVLLSLEEGSPLVTYQAMGHGLPSMVSPMGGGGVIKHEKNGIMVNPYDKSEIIAQMQRLAIDKWLLRSLGQQAYADSEKLLWSKVAYHRAKLIAEVKSQE